MADCKNCKMRVKLDSGSMCPYMYFAKNFNYDEQRIKEFECDKETT